MDENIMSVLYFEMTSLESTNYGCIRVSPHQSPVNVTELLLYSSDSWSFDVIHEYIILKPLVL